MKPLKAKEGKAVKNDPRTRDERVKVRALEEEESYLL